MKNNLNVNIDKNFNCEIIQKELRNQFGNEIYESWLKKIVFEENYKQLNGFHTLLLKTDNFSWGSINLKL